jgi:hypothetical protein
LGERVRREFAPERLKGSSKLVVDDGEVWPSNVEFFLLEPFIPCRVV